MMEKVASEYKGIFMNEDYQDAFKEDLFQKIASEPVTIREAVADMVSEDMHKLAMKMTPADEYVEKMAEGIVKEARLLTEKNPWGQVTEDEMQEFISLGAKVDAGQISEDEAQRFDQLAAKVPQNVVRPEAGMGIMGGFTGGAVGAFGGPKGAALGAGAGALAGAAGGHLLKRKRDDYIAQQQKQAAELADEIIKEAAGALVPRATKAMTANPAAKKGLTKAQKMALGLGGGALAGAGIGKATQKKKEEKTEKQANLVPWKYPAVKNVAQKGLTKAQKAALGVGGAGAVGGGVAAAKSRKKKEDEGQKTADQLADEIMKEASVPEFIARAKGHAADNFTRPNPAGPISEEDMAKFEELKARINQGEKLSPNELIQFKELSELAKERLLDAGAIGGTAALYGGLGLTAADAVKRRNISNVPKGLAATGIGTGLAALMGHGVNRDSDKAKRISREKNAAQIADEIIKTAR